MSELSTPDPLPPIITLLTDFGLGGSYVASMKGVVLSIQPAAVLVDITHCVGPQNVREAAWILAEATPRFPPGSIHVAVVDPGVGTDRAIAYAEIDGRHYIAPDNGLLSLLARRCPPTRLIRLENRSYWLPEVSHTFHGRDIMAPAAAHLSRGVDPGELGPPLERLVSLDWPRPHLEPRRIVGEIVWIDSFGNLITNIDRPTLLEHRLLPEMPGAVRPTIRCRDTTVDRIVSAYAQAPPGTLVALVGSSGLLELAVVRGSAASRLGAHVGDPVVLQW